jgi:hypothetical protein
MVSRDTGDRPKGTLFGTFFDVTNLMKVGEQYGSMRGNPRRVDAFAKLQLRTDFDGIGRRHRRLACGVGFPAGGFAHPVGRAVHLRAR